jgi:hypothetical protein
MSMDKDFNIVKSVYNSNYDAIKNIMELYKIEQFDLDCTYSKGSFWKDLKGPKNKTDLLPKNDNIIQANSENLPFEDNSMKSIMYDPPFIIAGATYKTAKDGSSLMPKRFEIYTSYNDLKSNYYNTLKELYRICDKGGFVVMKCQDTVTGGKQYFTHVMIMNMAMSIGFYPKDMVVLFNKVRMNSFGTKWKKQEHARKYHSYFWVFEKKKCRVNYDFIEPILGLQDSEVTPNT